MTQRSANPPLIGRKPNWRDDDAVGELTTALIGATPGPDLRQLEVSNLASAGLTNPEIGRRMYISPRTVETQLSRVYGKLGLSSRVELATAAVGRAY